MHAILENAIEKNTVKLSCPSCLPRHVCCFPSKLSFIFAFSYAAEQSGELLQLSAYNSSQIIFLCFLLILDVKRYQAYVAVSFCSSHILPIFDTTVNSKVHLSRSFNSL